MPGIQRSSQNVRTRILKAETIVILIVIVILLFGCNGSGPDTTKRARLLLSSVDDELGREIAEALEDTLRSDGYSVSTVYCENNIFSQLNQLQNALTQEDDLIILDCISTAKAYETVLDVWRKPESRIVLLNTEVEVDYADVQLVSESVYTGACARKLLADYMSENFPNADPGSVNVVVFADADSEADVKLLAGYQLIAEKFVRRYDQSELCYEKYEEDRDIFYKNEYGAAEVVTEPTGGLLLDDEGYAVLNPYYEPMIHIILWPDRNVQSMIDGQNAFDHFLISNPATEVDAVLCVNGEAALGVEDRIKYYLRQKDRKNGLTEKTVVFGVGDTEQNRELTLASETGGSAMRGFIADYAVEENMDSVCRALRSGKKMVIHAMSYYSVICERRIQTIAYFAGSIP